MAILIQDISQAASTTGSLVLGVVSGVAKLMPLNTLAASYAGTGTGAVTRTYKAKVEEIERSVIDFGADPTGVADSTTAFTNLLGSGARIWRVPAGTYKITNLQVNFSGFLKGDGRQFTHINCTTTTTHCVEVIGESGLGTSNIIRMRGIHFDYTGTGQAANTHGIVIKRKVFLDEVQMEHSTNDGCFFDSATGTVTGAPFFCLLLNCRFNDNGRDGCRVRFGANAHTFINCQFDRNNGVGFHHLTDGGATYGNTIIGGQASYNSSYGYYFESGTDANTMGLYAEYNGSTDHTTANGYVNTPYDFYIGDNTSRSHIGLGTVFSASYSHVRAPSRALNDGCSVTHGGDRVFTSTNFHLACESSGTVADLLGTATLTDVINKVNELITALEGGNAINT